MNNVLQKKKSKLQFPRKLFISYTSSLNISFFLFSILSSSKKKNWSMHPKFLRSLLSPPDLKRIVWNTLNQKIQKSNNYFQEVNYENQLLFCHYLLKLFCKQKKKSKEWKISLFYWEFISVYFFFCFYISYYFLTKDINQKNQKKKYYHYRLSWQQMFFNV